MRVVINETEVDALKKQDIALTKSANDMTSFGTREGAYSTNIEAYLSSNNRKLTQHAQSSTSQTDFPYLKNKAVIEQAGEQILNGFATLDSTNETFNFRCFYELSEITALIGDGLLNELNLDYSNAGSINHIWNYATVVANRNNSWEKGFIYPNINYGKWNSTTPFGFWNDLYPSIFCKYLFLRIFHSIGYAVTGEFLENDLFNREILPMVEIPETPNTFLESNKSRAEAFVNRRYVGTSSIGDPIEFDAFTINNNFQFSNGYRGFTKLSPSLYGDMHMSLTIDLFISSGNTAQLNLIQETSGTTKIDSYTLTTGTNVFNFTLSKKNETSKYYITILQSSASGFIDISSIVWENTFLPQRLLEGNTIFVSECLPKISKKDFIVTIINQYNLMLNVDNTLKKVDFSYFNSVQSNKSKAVDFSKLLDLEKFPEVTYELPGYAQNNYLRYETDENDNELRKNKNLGQGNITCNNQNLEQSKEIFKSKFAPITQVLVLCGQASATLKAYIQLWLTNETTIRTQNVKPRIAYLSSSSISTFPIYQTSGEGGRTPGSYGFDISPSRDVLFDELQFSVGLIPNYYKIIADMLLNTFFLKAFFKIKLKEYKQIDFKAPIYLDNSVKGFGDLQGYYHCNKINQFKVNKYESTEIELIKI